LFNAGEKKAISAKKVVDHLDEYLAACQLGITITALGIGMVGESTFEFILNPLISSGSCTTQQTFRNRFTFQ
jgi:CBS domain containing-hemolysin-like protein